MHGLKMLKLVLLLFWKALVRRFQQLCFPLGKLDMWKHFKALTFILDHIHISE